MNHFYVTDDTRTVPCTGCHKDTLHKMRSVIERADDLFKTTQRERQTWQCQQCQRTYTIEWSEDGSEDENFSPF
jgi:hypothetical protein